MQVVFREEALADLQQIADHIAEQDPRAASRVITRIHRVIYKTLCTLPLGGRLNPGTNTREYAVPGLPYLVVYLPHSDSIDVIGIFHTSRDPATKPRP